MLQPITTMKNEKIEKNEKNSKLKNKKNLENWKQTNEISAVARMMLVVAEEKPTMLHIDKFMNKITVDSGQL